MSSKACIASFTAGVVTTASLIGLVLLYKTTKKDRTHAGAVIEGNDLSLFYGDMSELTTVKPSAKFLDAEFYGKFVRDCIVVCCDIVLVRYNPASKQKECLVVERASEPVKGVWWWPGGRVLKGETFFDAAVRKAKQETGIDGVKPIQVLGVWNTFFPTSHWDTDKEKGTQTVQPIVLVEVEDANGAEVKLDETSENWRWIGLDPDTAKANGEDKYVLEALYRLREWDPSYISSTS